MPKTDPAARDYRATLFLPQTEFPMKAGLPEAEPRWLARWAVMDLYGRMRAAAKGRPQFILHDGPPYANGEIHLGTGINKILKDFVVRSQGMLGRDAPYVPGWDCHGLPIEWKIEERYRAEGKSKDEVSAMMAGAPTAAAGVPRRMLGKSAFICSECVQRYYQKMTAPDIPINPVIGLK